MEKQEKEYNEVERKRERRGETQRKRSRDKHHDDHHHPSGRRQRMTISIFIFLSSTSIHKSVACSNCEREGEKKKTDLQHYSHWHSQFEDVTITCRAEKISMRSRKSRWYTTRHNHAFSELQKVLVVSRVAEKGVRKDQPPPPRSNYSVVFFSNSLDAAMRKDSVSFSIPVFPSIIIIIIIVIIINIKVLATERRQTKRNSEESPFLLIKRIPLLTVCFSLSLPPGDINTHTFKEWKTKASRSKNRWRHATPWEHLSSWICVRNRNDHYRLHFI